VDGLHPRVDNVGFMGEGGKGNSLNSGILLLSTSRLPRQHHSTKPNYNQSSGTGTIDYMWGRSNQ